MGEGGRRWGEEAGEGLKRGWERASNKGGRAGKRSPVVSEPGQAEHGGAGEEVEQVLPPGHLQTGREREVRENWEGEVVEREMGERVGGSPCVRGARRARATRRPWPPKHTWKGSETGRGEGQKGYDNAQGRIDVRMCTVPQDGGSWAPVGGRGEQQGGLGHLGQGEGEVRERGERER